MGPGFRPEFGCRALPRPVHLAGQRLRRRPDKCDAGRRPSGRRIPRLAVSGQNLCVSSGEQYSFAAKSFPFIAEKRNASVCWLSMDSSVLHTVLFFGISVWGWYHYPRRALHAVETLDAQRDTAAYSPFLCRLGICPVRAEYPLGGYTRHPSPEPRTQRLTRRNTGRFHRLRHRQGR